MTSYSDRTLNMENDDDDSGDYDSEMLLEDSSGNNPKLSFTEEFRISLRLMKDSRINILLIGAPIAYIGAKSGYLGEFLCFCLSGIALIPLAERYDATLAISTWNYFIFIFLHG
jgi:hypothetical protein